MPAAHDADDRLIDFVRGRLSPVDAAWIEAEAAKRPDLAAEIATIRDVIAAFDGPSAIGPSAMPSVDRDPLAFRPARASDAVSRRMPIWPMAASAAAAVIVWQFAVVPLQSRATRVGANGPQASLTLGVDFRPEAEEAAIGAALRAVDGRVVDGPTAAGLWTIGFGTAEARDAAMEELASAPVVASVR